MTQCHSCLTVADDSAIVEGMERMKQVIFRAPEALRQRIKRAAAEYQLGEAEVIRQALEEFLPSGGPGTGRKPVLGDAVNLETKSPGPPIHR